MKTSSNKEQIIGKKLRCFAEIKTFANVLEFLKDIKGNWNKNHFKNNHPITLELACGKGEYTLALAEKFPDKNFIGVDIKGNRIWKGAKTALEKQMPNVAFLRIQIEHITDYFDSNEVKEIWITFPDPFVRKSKEKKRLTSSRFLNLYRQILMPSGKIHLKTDDIQLYEFTIETIQKEKCKLLTAQKNIYENGINEQFLEIKTFYEQQHLAAGKAIHYLCFRL